MPGYSLSALGVATKVRIGEPGRGISAYSVLTIMCVFAANSGGEARASQLINERNLAMTLPHTSKGKRTGANRHKSTGWRYILHYLTSCLVMIARRFAISWQYPECLLGFMLGSELRSGLRPALANFDGAFENSSDRKYSSQFMRRDGGQTHGCDASAGCAIRIPAKLAGSNFCSQIS